MYNLCNASRGTLVRKNTEQDRKLRTSTDKQSLRPMLDDTGTDERRYYQSAEFQKAMLERQLQRKFALRSPIEPAEEDTHRLSKSSLKRRGTAASICSRSFAMLDMTREVPEDRQPEAGEAREERGGEPEIPSSPYLAIVPMDYTVPSSNASNSSSEVKPQKSRKHRLPRIHLSSTGPFVSFARSMKTG